MHGVQAMLLVLSFTLDLEGCAAQVTSEHGLQQQRQQEGSRVLNLSKVIDSLTATDATAVSVAASVGSREASEVRYRYIRLRY